MSETWKPVIGFEGYYKVSNMGRVRSLDRLANCIRNGVPSLRKVKGRLRKLPLNKFGYPTITLTINSHRKCKHVHVMVLEAFVGLRPAGMQSCHWDGDKTNCRLTNLRWDTVSNNHLDQIRHGTYVRAKIKKEDVIFIRRSYLSYKKLSAMFGLNQNYIGAIKRGEYWKHVEA